MRAGAAVLAAAVCALAGPAARGAPGEWPQSRHDAQNTGAVELEAPRAGAPRAWTFDGSGRVWGYEPGMTVWSPPAVAEVDGRALLVAGSYDRTVYALDAATGEVRWRFTAGAPVFATPVIARQGDRVQVVAAANDRLVYAIDAALGRQLWVHSVEEYRPTLGGARLGAPCVGRAGEVDAVFVPHWVWDRSLGRGLQRGGLTALGWRDGKPRWTAELGDNELTAAIYGTVAGRGRLFLGSTNGNVYAVDAASGHVRWRHTELDAVRSPPALLDGPRPLVVMASKFGAVRALDAATGREVWQRKTGDRVTGAPAIVPSLGTAPGPAVVVGSYDRTLYALDGATGAVRWRYGARGGIYSSPAVAAGPAPLVLVSAWDHLLHAVRLDDGAPVFQSFTGRPLWDVAGLDESTWSSPVTARLGGRRMVYAGGYDGILRALPLDEAGRAAPPVRSNGAFWLSFPITLGPLALLAVWLTRRERQRRRRSQSQAPTSRSGTSA
ncbi:MAG TPA: PQQ-binding-like beta-propeller repeat protein [Polyangia bacterium]